MDAIEILLEKQIDNEMAKRVLRFHRANRDFIPRLVAELFWLKEQGRKAAGVKSITNFLRWEMSLQATPGEKYIFNDHFNPTFARIVLLLWTSLDGMLRMRAARAGVTGKIRRKRNGHALQPELNTLPGAEFLPGIGSDGATIIMDGLQYHSPFVARILRDPSSHERVSRKEASATVEPLTRLIGKAPDSNHPLLADWVHHLATQPECFHFLANTLLKRNPPDFSVDSLYEYARWTLYLVADEGRTFDLNNNLCSLYGRGLLYVFPQFNGRCDARHTEVDRVLGCTIAKKPQEGEPFRRVIFPS